MKILVTGAYGQLGSEIKDASAGFKNWDFVFTDADTLDITNAKAVKDYLAELLPDAVINCAAYTAVDKAETDEANARAINSLAVFYLAEATRMTGAKLVHISTDYVFDGYGSRPYTEADQVNPSGVYGKTKREGEVLAMKQNPDTVIIRTSWLYSAYGNNFVKTMLRLGREKSTLNVVFDQTGTPTCASDLAAAILQILEKTAVNPESSVPGIYHYSNEGVASWYDFARAVFEISGINCLVNPVLSSEFPTSAKRPEYSVLDKSKIKNTFGLTIPYWRESLTSCLKKLG